MENEDDTAALPLGEDPLAESPAPAPAAPAFVESEAEHYVGQAPEAAADTEKFVEEYIAAGGGQPAPKSVPAAPASGAQPPPDLAEIARALTGRLDRLEAMEQARQEAAYRPAEPPTARPESLEERITARLKRYPDLNVTDPTVRDFVRTQLQNEDLATEIQGIKRAQVSARQEMLVARNQADMDRAFAATPILNDLATKNPALAERLYETAFALWLADPKGPNGDATGAVKMLAEVIESAAKATVQQKLGDVGRKATVRPIAGASGKAPSLATVAPSGKPVFRPKNAGRGVQESAEAALHWLRSIGE